MQTCASTHATRSIRQPRWMLFCARHRQLLLSLLLPFRTSPRLTLPLSPALLLCHPLPMLPRPSPPLSVPLPPPLTPPLLSPLLRPSLLSCLAPPLRRQLPPPRQWCLLLQLPAGRFAR